MLAALTIAACSLLGAGGEEQSTESVFDLNTILSAPLDARTLKATEKEGIVTEEVIFHSESDGDKNVEIFGFFSYPKNARSLPSFIWNQGGLAQASTHWTEFGAKRGYAALCIDFPMPGYRSTGGYPIVSGIELGDAPQRAPIYHGAVALLRAVSFLVSRPEVDEGKIGMAGSSWGGFYTTLMVGIDPRLRAGSCMFGCGRLDLGNLWWDGQGWNDKRDKEFRERWRTTLDPAWRLAVRKTPIAWFTGTNDQFYWLPSVMASHAPAAGPRHLALLPNWNHALTPELDEQVFAWLDVHLKGAPAFTAVSLVEDGDAGGRLEARWKFSGPRQVARAQLLLSHGDTGNWRSRYWRTIPAEIQADTCVAQLPRGGFPYFISGTVIDRDGFRSTTPLKRLDLGLTEVTPDYDGCSPWGGFEPEHISFLQLQGLGAPKVTNDAKEGQQAAVLNPGRTTLKPFLFTSGWTHRLSLVVKAAAQADVTIALDGRFDAQPHGGQKVVSVGPTWTEVTLDFTPPNALNGSLDLSITSPPGSQISLDAVQFRPR